MNATQAKANLLESIFAHDAAVIAGDDAELAVVDSHMESHRLVLESVREECRKRAIRDSEYHRQIALYHPEYWPAYDAIVDGLTEQYLRGDK